MKIVNKTGYLKGAKTAKNPVNIIPSNLITTQGMAFPIKANGKTLYPNTGQYKFPTSPVVETPLKQEGDKKLQAGPVLKDAVKKLSKPMPAPKPVSKKKQLEDNDSWLENAVEIVDPLGVTSYDDVYRSYKNTGLSGETALEALGAIPLIGKIGKGGKIIAGGIGLLHKLAPKVKYLPKKVQQKAMDNLFKGYQTYAKYGGNKVDDFLGTTTKKFMDNVPYINPSSQKYIPAARDTFNYLQTAGKVKDAVSTALGSKDDSGFKYKHDKFKFNGRNIFPEIFQEGVKKTKVEKENPVSSWVKDRILETVTPTSYEVIPRVSEFIAGNKYNPAESIYIDGLNTSLKGDYDALALSLGRQAKYNTVVPQTKYKPVSDKNSDEKYYTIKDLDKKKLIEKYYEGKKEMEKLSKKYPGKIDYGFIDKAIDFLPNYINRNFISRKALRENAEKKLLRDYRDKGVVYQRDEGMYKDNSSYGPMSNFGTWEGKDKKGKYISYKDKIDYQGSFLGRIAKPILNQKDVEIYDRVYLDKKGNPIKKNGAKLIKYKNGSKSVSLAFSRGEKDPKGGLTQKGVDKYNRATGGNLKMAVTTPPSKLKPGSKAANRRKSFCARMSGVKGPMRKPNGKPTRKALALRKWNC